ncbi:MAG: AsmA family protein, partial [Bacteroidaceae bacterium]|nr:AsmA family protein [Bacteroidaceae bacterium]
MKKILKIAGIFLLAVILLVVSVPYLFKDKIEALIKEEGNKMLNARFDFGNLDISLIRNFPLASLTLEDFYLKGVAQFENDTLLAADEITAAVNVMSLFGDEGFDIQKVLLDEVSVKAIVMPDGTVNWDVMKESEDSAGTEEGESSPFRIKLQKLTLEDFNLIYDDRQGNMYAAVANMDAECTGDFGSSRTLLELATGIEALTFSMDGV